MAHVYLTHRQVRDRYGGISKMTLYRWRQNADLDFPKPVQIGQRIFWRLEDLERWESQLAPVEVSPLEPA